MLGETVDDLRDHLAASHDSNAANNQRLVEDLLQELLLRGGLLEDDRVAEEECDVAMPTEASQFVGTLRDLRREQLGNLAEQSQVMLLGGTLYEYSDATEVPSPESTQHGSPRITLGGGLPWHEMWTSDIADSSATTRSSAGDASFSADANMVASDLVHAEVRHGLERILDVARQTNPWQGDLLRRSIENLEWTNSSLQSTMHGSMSSMGMPEDSFQVGSPISRRYADSAGGSALLTGIGQGGLGFGETYSAGLEQSQNIGGLQQPQIWFGDATRSVGAVVRHLISEAIPDVGPDAGIIGLLRQIGNDGIENIDVDTGLASSVRRVRQMGTVLAGQRLSEEEISALPKVHFDQAKDGTCAVCLEPYHSGELLTELRCGHFYHVECISRWLQRAIHCPLCRSNVGNDSKSSAPDAADVSMDATTSVVGLDTTALFYG